MTTVSQSTGYFLLDQLFDAPLLWRLTQESLEQLSRAGSHQCSREHAPEERGGKPRRKLTSAPGGPVQDAIYQSSTLLRKLEQTTGYSMVPTGTRGTYSYYTAENDFLDIHRDINTCDLTLISCLHSTIREASPSGLLYLYTPRQQESLRTIYQDRFWGYETVQLIPGQSILIEGGIVPHGVNPIQGSDQRIISALCYQRL